MPKVVMIDGQFSFDVGIFGPGEFHHLIPHAVILGGLSE